MMGHLFQPPFRTEMCQPSAWTLPLPRVAASRRADRFLKGPIPLNWIREHVQCPADRLLLVLRAHGDMRRSNEIKVTADVLRDAGIADRKAAYRAMKKLEVSGSLSVSRKPGRRPVIRLAQTARCPG